MTMENQQTVSGLQERVLHKPVVMEKLFQDFTINVTEMFRDPGFFLAFREKIVPELRKYPFLRVWHAGCSSGEEVYSMAILLYEEGLYERTQIYATDINEEVLKKAEAGVFPLEKMRNYTRDYIRSGGNNAFAEYYQVQGKSAVFDSALRKNIVFAAHDLTTDSSFNEFQVIICRNVLIYFNYQLQNHVHELFLKSLSAPGYLGLGSKEGIENIKHGSCYEYIDRKQKLYRKRGESDRGEFNRKEFRQEGFI
jgi:chemotaxis protein methyltransferase CheR